jgi:glycosyltransferase involved in cell wall biosynthesis
VNAPQRLTAVVLTRDEAGHLADCLRSLAWCDERLVVDSGSTDGTVELARRQGVTVVTHPFENYSRQRNFALAQVATPWLLFVDADERVPSALAQEIGRTLGAPQADGYWLPRRNVFWGHPMQGGGWWPDHQLRLLRVEASHYDPDRAVHELAEVDGPTAALDSPLEHLNYESPEEFRAKQRAYAGLEAQHRRATGWRFRRRQLATMPLRELWRRYVALGGWRDGLTGLVACAGMAAFELRVLRLLAEDAAPAGVDQPR